ncbi:uncharacterized protein LOC129593081 [Paramacrobiotus metropolitanus]|uniref:uncharacterized protein LOC129593081 n=1 Tax=Paramacrobiotus metropolitanus TaxID=2943436 RepID=UPI002445C02D|nr:uncharacterized protein LOC129593081 [Paramacrobiotus metropolitanus]
MECAQLSGGSGYRSAAVLATQNLMLGAFNVFAATLPLAVGMGDIVLTAVIQAAWIVVTSIVGVCGFFCEPTATSSSSPLISARHMTAGLRFLRLYIAFLIISISLTVGMVTQGALVLTWQRSHSDGFGTVDPGGPFAIGTGAFSVMWLTMQLVRAVAAISDRTSHGIAPAGAAPASPQTVFIAGYHPPATRQSMLAEIAPPDDYPYPAAQTNSATHGLERFINDHLDPGSSPQITGYFATSHASRNMPPGALFAYSEVVKY